jgi:hypothetical protein
MQLPDPSMLEALMQGRQASGWGGVFYGVHPALVKDIADPDNQGRVKVALPWLPDSAGAACEVTCAGPTSSARCGTARTRRPKAWTAPARTTGRCCARATA